MRPALVPLLLVALLLVSLQPGVESITTVVDGEQTLTDAGDAVIVANGNLTIPEGSTANTSLYVIAGSVRIDGTVSGRVTQLAGEVRIEQSGTVTDSFQVLGGDQTIADGADVDLDVVAEPFTAERTPAEAFGVFLLQAVLLGVATFLIGRRVSALLATVGRSIRHHPVVSGTVGFLAIVSLLALFVFMAFTIVLLPVSLLGILGGTLVFLYAYACLGYLLGQHLLADRPGLATASGAILFFGASEVLSFVPVVGSLVPLALLVIGVGAVLLTYFGLREFHPPALQSVGGEGS